MKIKLFFTLCLSGISILSFAQLTPQLTTPQDSTKPTSTKRAAQKAALKSMGVLYDKEWTLEGGIHTGGWSIGYNMGLIRTYYKTTFWHFGLEELKSPREASVSNTDGGSGRSTRMYIYAKQNALLNLQVGYGLKNYFSEKADKNGLGVGYSYCIGANLGLLKPYYLDIIQPNQGQTQQQRPVATHYTPENERIFLDESRIDGASSFTYGFGEVTPIPDWGSGEEFAKAAEAGIKINAYPIKMPLMVTAPDNQAIFFNFYLIFQFGQRS
jgi:hypothetical protein